MWFFSALIVALLTSISMILAKHIMKEMNERVYLFISNLFAIPLLFFIVIYFYRIPTIDNVFIISMILSTIIGVIAALLAYRAIRFSEISLVSPLSAFNPLVTAIFAFIILNEGFTNKASVGVVLICFGSYLLNLSQTRNGRWFAPVLYLFKNKWILMSFMAYFLWAITPLFEKIAILHTAPTTPPFVSLVGLISTNLIFGALSLKGYKSSINKIKKYIPLFLLIGVIGAIGQSLAMISFSLTNPGYSTAIFKLSIIFNVIFGWIFFKEQNIKDRLLGSMVMLGGVLLLVT